MKLINDKNGDRLGLLTLLSSALSLVMCLTLFAGTSWAWFYDTATCAVEDIKIKTNLGTKVNVTVTDMSAVSLMLAAEGESTEAEEETEQPTEWTLEPDKGYYVTLQWPVDENAQTGGYCVITIGSSQYRTEVFSDALSFICYTTGMEYPVVMKIDGFSGGYEEEENEMIIRKGGKIGEEPEPEPTPESTPEVTETPAPETTPETTPEPTPEPEATETPVPETTPEPTPEIDATPEVTEQTANGAESGQPAETDTIDDVPVEE